MFCWWSLAQLCPIRSWSYYRSVNSGGRTYSSCTMLKKDRRNPGPPTGNWQSGGGCQWAAMGRQNTNSGGCGYGGCQVGGLHHIWFSLSSNVWLLLIRSINALFIVTVGMKLLSVDINVAYMVFRDVGCSCRAALWALLPKANHSCRWFLQMCNSRKNAEKKGKFCEKGEMSCGIKLNVILYSFHCGMWTKTRRG